MSSFADFNVGTLKLHTLGETTQLTGTQLITPSHTATWSELAFTVQNMDEIAQEVVLKEDVDNKSVNIVTDATSDIKYPSVKAVKTYVDSRSSEQTQFVNSTLQALQALQAGLNNTVQVDTTKEDLVNKSTNVETDATSDTKYPTVKAIKTYVDKRCSSLLLLEGESTVRGTIHWTCGSCPMDGVYGLLLPSRGKLRRVTGMAYGPLGNLDSIQVQLKTYTLDALTSSEPSLLRTISFQTHPTLSMLYASDTDTESLLPSTGNVMLLFQETGAKDSNALAMTIPPYIRFRITLEYETHI